ncbi:dipeptidase D [bacterium A37T11]|nr:dipeptidase D [bacterium A37T11]
MNEAIRGLTPTAVWNHFADLNAVPRPSKKEQKVIAFIKDFGAKLGLETTEDAVGNVIIRKPASPGMENRVGVILQSHLDMVHQKNADTDFNFDTQGIDMVVEDGWVKAKGTTLGADNGLGVATIMAILESTDIPHPTLEALFTIDEETGMTGALGLKGGLLKGRYLLNLDTEDDDELTIGCAGGVDVTAERTYIQENLPADAVAYRITVKGLRGGHSGMEIHLGFGNANKLMNRLLSGLEKVGLRVAEINGGGLRNAIPRESFAVVIVPQEQTAALQQNFDNLASEIDAEFTSLEPGLVIELEKATDLPDKVMETEAQAKLLKAIYTAHNGVYRMSPDIADLVETSNNLAQVVVKDGKARIASLTRSSVESSKWDLAGALKAAFELAEATVSFTSAYPGWAPDVHSPLLKLARETYMKQNHEEPKVLACHAGLECGILGANYPGMNMISFGPTIKGAHSPEERASVASVQKFWKYVLQLLKDIPSAD